MGSEDEINARTVEAAVSKLTARYCDAVARFDPDQFAELWTVDADWVVPGAGTTSGRDRIARVFGKLRGGYALCTQELMSGWVEEGSTGRRAAARWQIREYQWRDGAPPSCVMGIYSDQLALDDDEQWRFAQRRFDIMYRGPVDLSGSVTVPPANLPEVLGSDVLAPE